MRRERAPSSWRRHTGNEPRDWISSARPSARSLATTLPAAPPVRFDGRSRERSSRCEATASSRSWVSVSFTESSIRLRRRSAPPPPKPRNGHEAGGAGVRGAISRDKAKVEVAVLLAPRWIIAKLRNRRFFSITELNDAIRDCVTTLNERVTRHLGASRRMLFDDVERTTLKPLPAEPYVYAEWKQCRVGLDYHVEVEKHFYSVPHTLLREKMWARITARTVEVFHHGQRVAAHVRSSSNRMHSTVREHMPSSHQRYADWTPERIKRQAGEIGPKTSALVGIILRERTHPERGFRACVGIMRLVKSYGAERLEAACPPCQCEVRHLSRAI